MLPRSRADRRQAAGKASSSQGSDDVKEKRRKETKVDSGEQRRDGGGVRVHVRVRAWVCARACVEGIVVSHVNVLG